MMREDILAKGKASLVGESRSWTLMIGTFGALSN